MAHPSHYLLPLKPPAHLLQPRPGRYGYGGEIPRQDDRGHDQQPKRHRGGHPNPSPSESVVFVNYNGLKVLDKEFERRGKFDIVCYKVTIKKARRFKLEDSHGKEVFEVREADDLKPPPAPVCWRIMKRFEQDQREMNFMIYVSTPT